MLNAQLAWQHGNWLMTLYATNLTDQHYIGALNSGLVSPAPRASTAYGATFFFQ